MIWWLEIWIQVVVILLQLYFTFGVWSMDSNFDYYPRKNAGFKGTQKLKILQYSLSEHEDTFMLIASLYISPSPGLNILSLVVAVLRCWVDLDCLLKKNEGIGEPFIAFAIMYSFLLFNLGKFWGTLENSVPCTASSLNCRTQKLQGSFYKKAATRNERLLKPLCAETWNWNCLFSSLYFDTTHILLS